MKFKYSLILPCFNELENLKLLIPKLLNALNKYKFEIIIVDDNSVDNTINRLSAIFKNKKNIKYILRKKNRSLGLSIKEGIKKSSSDIIIVMDSDFNHRPEDLKKMLNIFEKKNLDMVCGSRFLKGGSSNTFLRHFCSLVFNFFVNLITGGKLSDNLSGFFILKKKYIINRLDEIFYGYGDFYIRLLYFIQKRKINILDHPVKYDTRKFGQSKSRLVKMFISYSVETIKVKLKY